jgi:hypothetical protein
MILANHGIIGSQIASFDADALAFFNRVTTAGGTLSTTEKNAVNQLVLDMKTYGIWSSMKAIYPMVGASAAACAQNLKSSSFTGTFTSGWTYASTGVTPNGTSAYMNTGFIPNSTLTQNSTHISIYSRTNNIVQGYDFNSGISNPNCLEIICRYTGGSAYYSVNSTESIGDSVSDSLGLYLATRTTSTNDKLFKNNSLINNRTAVSTGLSSSLLTIASHSGYGGFTNRQYAFASIGDGLTDTQASNFYTAVQAFQTTLSRNV